MKFHQKLVLLTVLIFSISCTRKSEEPVAPSDSHPDPAIVYSKEVDFPRVYALLTGRAADQRAAARAITGLFVDWEVYVIGLYEWDTNQGERLKKIPSISDDELKRLLKLTEHPQRYLIAPSSKYGTGIVMRVGDGFKGEDFGLIVSGFPTGQKLHAKGRIWITSEGSVELRVYEISPSSTP
ncbi:MAG TPA: hypothetical protein VGM64_09900 [Lacunisphaera sp.]|jgi:hypothetical protein